MPISTVKSLLTLRADPVPMLLLITDSYGVPGASVVELIVRQYAQLEYPVHYVSASCVRRTISLPGDASIQYYYSTYNNYGEDKSPLDAAMENVKKTCKNTMNRSSTSRLNKIDSQLLSDPNYCAYKPTSDNDTQLIANKLDSLELYKNDSSNKCVIILDKLEDLLLYTNVRSLISRLKTLTNGGCHVLAWGCRDVLSSIVMASLEHSTTAALHLSNCGGDSTTGSVMVRAIYNRPGGKHINTTEILHLKHGPADEITFTTEPVTEGTKSIMFNPIHDEASFGVTEATQPRAGGTVTTADTSEQNAIFKSQTTFSLTLSDRERQVKNSLLLPHQRVHLTDGRAVAAGEGGGGVVHYTPDSEDWDEEDPDDDLDI